MHTAADKKLEWIQAQIAAGREVYLTTYTRSTRIDARSLPQVRVRRGHLEVQHGKRWINHDGSQLSTFLANDNDT